MIQTAMRRAQERAHHTIERAIHTQERALLREQTERAIRRSEEHHRVESWEDQLQTDDILIAPPTPILVFPKNIEIASECSICIQTDSRLVLGCRHTVCVSCIQKIKTCPICRHEIQLDLVKSV